MKAVSKKPRSPKKASADGGSNVSASRPLGGARPYQKSPPTVRLPAGKSTSSGLHDPWNTLVSEVRVEMNLKIPVSLKRQPFWSQTIPCQCLHCQRKDGGYGNKFPELPTTIVHTKYLFLFGYEELKKALGLGELKFRETVHTEPSDPPEIWKEYRESKSREEIVADHEADCAHACAACFVWRIREDEVEIAVFWYRFVDDPDKQTEDKREQLGPIEWWKLSQLFPEDGPSSLHLNHKRMIEAGIAEAARTDRELAMSIPQRYYDLLREKQ